jgi:predicted Zn-dependent protease
MSESRHGRMTLAGNRPVLDREQIAALCKRLLAMASTDVAEVSVVHTARVITRLANGQVLSADDGDTLFISVGMAQGGANIGHTVETNQLDDSVLKPMIQQCERLARESIDASQKNVRVRPEDVPDKLVPVQLWHEETVRAMTAATAREQVLPTLLTPVKTARLNGAGFVGLMARAEGYLDRQGHSTYNEETDTEVTVTARTPDGRSSGWGGQAARDWTTVNAAAVSEHAIHTATLGGVPVALEPGRRTAILSAAAVAQLARGLAGQLDAANTDSGGTGFSRLPHGNKLRQRVFDERITLSSNPADPDGGYCPYFGRHYGTPAMTWVERGVLTNLSYNPIYALARGKPYTAPPTSLRMSGGPTTIEEMIANCTEGVYVNRFSSVRVNDGKTCLTTGVTRDGCFFIKNGKLTKAVKNFSILESPHYFLNKIMALGVPQRVAFGYTPPRRDEESWPLPPVIVPPMMVRDFNFNALIDAV